MAPLTNIAGLAWRSGGFCLGLDDVDREQCPVGVRWSYCALEVPATDSEAKVASYQPEWFVKPMISDHVRVQAQLRLGTSALRGLNTWGSPFFVRRTLDGNERLRGGQTVVIVGEHQTHV
jgi:hypothetical protein